MSRFLKMNVELVDGIEVIEGIPISNSDDTIGRMINSFSDNLNSSIFDKKGTKSVNYKFYGMISFDERIRLDSEKKLLGLHNGSSFISTFKLVSLKIIHLLPSTILSRGRLITTLIYIAHSATFGRYNLIVVFLGFMLSQVSQILNYFKYNNLLIWNSVDFC